MLYRTLTIGGKDYKLRLTTKHTVELEKKLGGNPVNGLMNMRNGALPSATYVSTCLHACLQPLNKNISIDKVYDLMDQAAEEGEGTLELIDVLSDVFQDCGLIPKDDPNEDAEEEEDGEEGNQEAE